MLQVETHCHTAEGSICANIPAARGMELYAKAGYQAVFITDHYHRQAFAHLQPETDWQGCMDWHLAGYHAAKEAGEALGLRVYLGTEIQFDAHPSYDFLVYGQDEAFLRAYPRLYAMDPMEFGRFAKEKGLLIFHAHPYRYTGTPVEPRFYEGMEVYNGHPRHHSHNRKAVNYAFEHGLYRISGSDFHREEDCGLGGVMLPEEVDSERKFVEYYRKNGSPELVLTYEPFKEEVGD